jgi:hypothetical protein
MTTDSHPQKDFDCVEMKRQGQVALHARLAGMTPEQQAAYWAERNRELDARLRRAKEAQPRKRSA